MKKTITLISVLIAIVLVFTVVFSFEYKKSADKVSVLQERLVQLTELSEEIEQTYDNLMHSVDEVIFNCSSEIKSLITSAESDINEFEKYANELTELIKEYEQISHYDYSNVYNECNVEAIVEETFAWREEALQNAIQWDEESHYTSSGVSVLDDVTARVDEDIQDMIDEYNGVENYSLEKIEKNTLFAGVEEIIENKRINEKIEVLETTSNSMRKYMIISVVVDVILIISLIIVFIKFRKDKAILTEGELI